MIYKILRRLDMSAISLSILGCFLPIAYYLFYCHGWVLNALLTFQFLAFIIIQTISLQDWFYQSKHLKLRTNAFFFYGVIIGGIVLKGFIES